MHFLDEPCKERESAAMSQDFSCVEVAWEILGSVWDI